MGKFGIMELLLVLAVPGLIFIFGFWVGRLSGKNSANKAFLDRDKN